MANGEFQSRSGFSPCLDHMGVHGKRACKCVSIPFWVFSLPRHLKDRDDPPGEGSFNPVLGFLPASTPNCGLYYMKKSEVSIPFWVFSLPRPYSYDPDIQNTEVSIPFWVFSLPRPTRCRRRRRSATSFNPVLGFLPASTVRRRSRTAVAVRPRTRSFNPVLGFLPASTRQFRRVARRR